MNVRIIFVFWPKRMPPLCWFVAQTVSTQSVEPTRQSKRFSTAILRPITRLILLLPPMEQQQLNPQPRSHNWLTTANSAWNTNSLARDFVLMTPNTTLQPSSQVCNNFWQLWPKNDIYFEVKSWLLQPIWDKNQLLHMDGQKMFPAAITPQETTGCADKSWHF